MTAGHTGAAACLIDSTSSDERCGTRAAPSTAPAVSVNNTSNAQLLDRELGLKFAIDFLCRNLQHFPTQSGRRTAVENLEQSEYTVFYDEIRQNGSHPRLTFDISVLYRGPQNRRPFYVAVFTNEGVAPHRNQEISHFSADTCSTEADAHSRGARPHH